MAPVLINTYKLKAYISLLASDSKPSQAGMIAVSSALKGPARCTSLILSPQPRYVQSINQYISARVCAIVCASKCKCLHVGARVRETESMRARVLFVRVRVSVCCIRATTIAATTATY